MSEHPLAWVKVNRVEFDTLFAEGRELLEKGKYPEAGAKLSRSEELAPAVGTLLNLAYCYEQLGKLRSAMEAYLEAERLANVAGEAKRDKAERRADREAGSRQARRGRSAGLPDLSGRARLRRLEGRRHRAR